MRRIISDKRAGINAIPSYILQQLTCYDQAIAVGGAAIAQSKPLNFGQILVRMLVRHDHGHQRNAGNRNHIECRSKGGARRRDQRCADERCRTTEQRVSHIEAKGEARVTHLSGERLAQVAGKGTVVNGEDQAHDQLDHEDGHEIRSAHQDERRNGEDDEAHTCGD